MVTLEQAVEIASKLYPNTYVEEMFDLGDYYVAEVLEKSSKGLQLDPFFSVDKKTGKTKEFSPGLDLDNWSKARADGPVYKKNDDIEHSGIESFVRDAVTKYADIF